MILSAPFTGTTGAYQIPLTIAMRGPDGKFGGVVMAALEPAFFVTLLRSVRYQDSVRVFLAHEGGNLVAGITTGDEIAKNVNIRVSGTFFSRHIESEKTESVLQGNALIFGGERMAVARTLRHEALDPSSPTFVLLIGNEKRLVFEHWRKETFADAGRFGILAFAIIGLFFLHRRAQEKLEEEKLARLADKNTAKDHFLATMSHELRSPLNGIIGFSQMIEGRVLGRENEKYFEYATHIRKSGEHLLALVNDLLDLAKIEAGKRDLAPAPCDPREIWEVPCISARALADRKDISLHMNIPDGAPPVFVDKRAIQQCLVNLLSNAVKFTPSRGAVTCGTEYADGRVLFAVTDTGLGISAEDLSRLGRPFEQIKDPYKADADGTGLGLAITRKLAELMGGELTMASAPGRGTRATVSLPHSPPADGRG